MSNIYDRFRKHNPKLKKHDGDYGIEIETETKAKYDPPEMHFWRWEPDNSLRDFGIEYILKSPLSFADANAALDDFGAKTKALKLIPDSNSTSVHIHANILNWNFLTLAKLFTAYALYENLLIRFSGPTRRSNLFCMPICDAEQTARDMVSICQNFSKQNYQWLWDHISEESNKYAAFNLASIGRIGSVEFRSFRGDPRPEAIKPWLSLIDHLIAYSKSVAYPTTIIDDYRSNPDKLLKSIFGVIGSASLLNSVPAHEDHKKLVEKNLGYAAHIAYSVKDWNLMDKTPDPIKYKQSKGLDKYCVDQWNKKFDDLDENMKDIAIMLYKQAGGALQAAVPANPWNEPVNWQAVNNHLNGIQPAQGVGAVDELPMFDEDN